MEKERIEKLIIQLGGREALKVSDLEKMLCVGENNAQKIMRQIKNNSDRLKIKGVVHVSDYILWADKP